MIRQSIFPPEFKSVYSTTINRVLAINGYPDCFMVTTPDETYNDFTMQRGYANGYVILHPGHKYFGVDYNEIDVEVHGGLTFSKLDEVNNTWVIGFDTHHGGDNKRNCDEIYCRAQTIKLFEQLNHI
jgi:hypothetical protein